MRRILTVALALAMAIGGTVLVAAPASAAYQTCTRYGMVYTATNQLVYYEFGPDASPICELKPGDNNDRVGRLQYMLNLCYGPRGRVTQLFSPELLEDNLYGSLTAGAVRAVQRHLGVQVDGWAGPKTRSNMAHYTGGSPDQCIKPKLPLQVAWVF
jgi:murein L,D-transpeptidase YcbB/YkuD